MKPINFWEQQHHGYAKKDWIDKPSIFAQQAIKYFPKQGKILELGCGHGQDSRFFASNGYEVLATDFSKTGLDYAKNKTKDLKIKYQTLDMSKGVLAFNGMSFDVVYSHLSLHYFYNNITKKLVSEIHRVLKDGGIFAALFNTIDDPEIPELKMIEDNYYLEEKTGLYKRYFDVPYITKITQNKFEIVIADDKGKTYKDEIETLIRFIGKKIT